MLIKIIERNTKLAFMMLTFSKLFKEINQPYIPRKCLRCQDFLPTKKFKGIRDCFKHYDGQKKKNPFTEKPIAISRHGYILTYKISIQKYKDYYNFENSHELVDDF